MSDLLWTELDNIMFEEFNSWKQSFIATEEAMDQRMARTLSSTSFFAPWNCLEDPMAYVNRMNDHLQWRRQIRKYKIEMKLQEMEKQLRAAHDWWVRRGGAKNGGRRLEEGLCGLCNTGRGRGAGGAYAFNN